MRSVESPPLRASTAAMLRAKIASASSSRPRPTRERATQKEYVRPSGSSGGGAARHAASTGSNKARASSKRPNSSFARPTCPCIDRICGSSAASSPPCAIVIQGAHQRSAPAQSPAAADAAPSCPRQVRPKALCRCSARGSAAVSAQLASPSCGWPVASWVQARVSTDSARSWGASFNARRPRSTVWAQRSRASS